MFAASIVTLARTVPLAPTASGFTSFTVAVPSHEVSVSCFARIGYGELFVMSTSIERMSPFVTASFHRRGFASARSCWCCAAGAIPRFSTSHSPEWTCAPIAACTSANAIPRLVAPCE